MKRFLITLWLLASFPAQLAASEPAQIEKQARAIAAELRCPVCQNLSAADSPSKLAQQMREIIESQLREGKTPDEIKSFFVSKYGKWVLLAPPRSGFSLLVWVLPYLALGGGVIFVIFTMRRWLQARRETQPQEPDSEIRHRIQMDLQTDKHWDMAPEIEGPRGPLLRERAKLYTELRDLEFDYQAGRISQTDYEELRRGYEEQAAAVLKELDSWTPPATSVPAPKVEPARRAPAASSSPSSQRGWMFAAGGALLLIFGVTLGVLLSRSLRPRTSPDDTITGGFLTGTGSQRTPLESGAASQDIQSLLAKGRSAFERREWPEAIDAFKNVLAMDANQPEAHSYMGLILAGAGHADSALMAFDRALSIDPNFPLALWGSGMVLYQQKGDADAGTRRLQELLAVLPPGPEKEEIQKTIVELAAGNDEGTTGEDGPAQTSRASITGTITVAPELKALGPDHGVLFVIARSAESGQGPPLAVKRFERPVFPLSFSLGQENTMIPGTQFKGKVVVTARLDRDGNPVTREAGDLAGAYKNNPVDVNSQATVDIVLDHRTQ